MQLNMFLALLTFVGSCKKTPGFHLADLKKSSAPPSDIVLFEDESDFSSTVPSHNVLPPHRRTERKRTIWFLNGNCIKEGKYKFCSDNDRLNSRLRLTIDSLGSETQATQLGGTVSDFLYRLIGSPPASLYQMVRYGENTFGFVHSYGFSIFHQGRFCKSVATNPNGKLSFGVETAGTPLIYTSPPLTEVDRPVEGWREYDLKSLCE